MNKMILFINLIAIATTFLSIESTTSLIYAQTLVSSDLPMTTINETNSTVDVLNKTLPSENTTNAIPVSPM